jgi:hypothetical protein
MDWPITLSQDKVAVDIISMSSSKANDELLAALGFRHPDTGPWSNWGYYWRWGNSSQPSPQHIHPKRSTVCGQGAK